ncbi:AraC family transcriptional regulator [Pedobacter sp. PAMC26386]|nr:AraC family transcriptional regulator [Pedobacter sp. PAMC26386]
MINSWKNSCLDSINYTSGENFKHSFPDHFHEEYTIGVAVKGIQRFDLMEKSFFVEPLSVFLIRPGQLHAHYPIADLGWSFKSIYLSPDLMTYLLQHAGIQERHSFNPIIQDQSLAQEFLKLHEQKTAPKEKEFGAFLVNLYQRLAVSDDEPSTVLVPNKIIDITTYLSEQLNHKLNLDQLSVRFQVDKFQLIRQFKKHKGVTPNTYLTILRIEKARKLMNLHYPIVEAALEAGFYDQSHFHHSFLHYTGVTPGSFIKAI